MIVLISIMNFTDDFYRVLLHKNSSIIIQDEPFSLLYDYLGFGASFKYDHKNEQTFRTITL